MDRSAKPPADSPEVRPEEALNYGGGVIRRIHLAANGNVITLFYRGRDRIVKSNKNIQDSAHR